MKATVMEIKGKHAVLLAKDGTFIKMKCRNLMIGDVVSVKETKKFKIGKLGAVVAAASFALLMGGGVYSYATPAYFVSLDVNPGVILEVNMYDRVIGTEAVNEDAEAVIEGLDLENTDITDAVSLTVDRIDELGYFDEGGGEILIGTTSENEETAEEAAEEIGTIIEEEVIENEIDVEVTAKVVGYEMVQAAKAIEGMTPGKYNIIVNHLGIAPENAQDYVGTSVKDIMKEVKALRAQNNEDADDAEDETETDLETETDTLLETAAETEVEVEIEEENETEKAKEKKIKEKNVSENNGKSEKKNSLKDADSEENDSEEDMVDQAEVKEKEIKDSQSEAQKEKSEKKQKPVKSAAPDISAKPETPAGKRP